MKNSGINNAEQEFKWLASNVLKIPEYKLYLNYKFSEYELNLLDQIISRREAGEPLQYIIGSSVFYGREFLTGSGSLIPRQDTETLIEATKYIFKPEQGFKFLDFGTGTGCIAITLLLEFQNAKCFMAEISEEAKFYAKKNLLKFNLKSRSEFLIPDECDLIISNPPYIPTDEIKLLNKSVKDYEPLRALDGGHDGMKFYKYLFELGNKILNRDGFLILEIGNNYQAEILKSYDENFKFVKYFYDSSNFPRCIILKHEA